MPWYIFKFCSASSHIENICMRILCWKLKYLYLNTKAIRIFKTSYVFRHWYFYLRYHSPRNIRTGLGKPSRTTIVRVKRICVTWLGLRCNFGVSRVIPRRGSCAITGLTNVRVISLARARACYWFQREMTSKRRIAWRASDDKREETRDSRTTSRRIIFSLDDAVDDTSPGRHDDNYHPARETSIYLFFAGRILPLEN